MLEKLNKSLEKFYFSKHKSALANELDQIDDFFMLITFSELYGLENPYALYTAELLPLLMPKFHKWHTKIGIKSNFFDNFPCTCC